MAQQAWFTSTSVPLIYLIQGSYTGEKLEQRSGKSFLIKKKKRCISFKSK